MYLLAKYNTQTPITFPMIKAAVRDFAATGDWTPATGDAKISKDGGNFANTTNNPAAVGGTGSVGWTLTLTATELSCAVADIQIVDSATKAVDDQYLKVYTYGNPSAKIPIDLSDVVRLGLTALPNAAADAAGGIPATKLASLILRATTGTVTNTGFSPTATQFEFTDTEATADHYKGLACYATSGAMNGQCLGVVTASSSQGGGTRTRLTVSGAGSGETIANAVTFILV